MNIADSALRPGERIKRTNSGRRNFIWKIGGAVTAILASAAPVLPKPMSGDDANLKNKVARLSDRLEMLENEKEIRSLHKTYETMLDKGMYKEVETLFTDNAEVIFNGGIFKGRKKGIRRLFSSHFSAGRSGKRIEPAPGFRLNEEEQRGMVDVAPDRRSAKARFAYSIQIGAPIVSDSLLVKMARLQGEGVKKWWEGGVYALSCVKYAEDGNWRITRLEYQTMSMADYKPGKSHATPISANPFSRVYPHEPTGPDRLIHL